MDSVVTSVMNKFESRAEFGQKKYGTNLDRKDLSFYEWLNHAQEELMDGILYLEKIKQEHLASEATSSAHDSTTHSVDNTSGLADEQGVIGVIEPAKEECDNSPSYGLKTIIRQFCCSCRKN